MRGALVCLSLLLACSDARFVVPVMPMAPKPHVHKACAPFDGKISGPPVIAATLVDAVQAATDPATGIVSFVSGNRAMNPLALNFGASVSCLPRPFPFVMVPLDAAGRQELSRVGLIRLYHDSEAEQRFLPSESLDGRREFHAMAKYKWEIARRMLAQGLSMPPAPGYTAGRPVLWFDPDIVVYRNPLHYVAGLPQCDMVTQMEICGLDLLDLPRGEQGVDISMSAALQQRIGTSALLGRLWPKREVLFNTGFVMLQPSTNALRLADIMLERFRANAAANVSLDDQVTFVNMMSDEFYLREAGDGATFRTRNAAMRDSVLSGRCSTWVHRGSGWSFTMWPLNPLLFPLRPTEELTRMYSSMLESPYLKHYNWMIGSGSKVADMVKSGDWLLPPSLATVPQPRPSTKDTNAAGTAGG